jgi:DNA mismatch repair ATPase MutS
LQGTNSRERQIAVVTVLEKLLSSGALGLISTHDLDLATVTEIESVSQVVHFREYFETDRHGNEVMRFDYRMRPGPTPTTNALKLLQLVGLDAQSVKT